jgi:hypothetical protein
VGAVGQWSDWCAKAIDAIREIRGGGPVDEFGRELPNSPPSDAIAILGKISPALLAAVKALSFPAGMPQPSEFVDDDTGRTQILDFDVGLDGETVKPDGSSGITAEKYLAATARAGRAWDRAPDLALAAWASGIEDDARINADDLTVAASIDGKVRFYTPGTNADYKAPNLHALRSAIGTYQRALVASAHWLAGWAPGARLDTASSSLFWSAMTSLCSYLDVLAESPPPSLGSQVKGAIKDSLDESATAAGELVADAADLVGRTGGKVASGFFNEASFTSLLVVGIGVFLYLK